MHVRLDSTHVNCDWHEQLFPIVSEEDPLMNEQSIKEQSESIEFQANGTEQ